jgi:hypothetical protein
MAAMVARMRIEALDEGDPTRGMPCQEGDCGRPAQYCAVYVIDEGGTQREGRRLLCPIHANALAQRERVALP